MLLTEVKNGEQLIKQSQDEGTTNDEITWKISPVNERLQAVSKQLPETIRVLANSSRLNSLRIRQCSQNKVLNVEFNLVLLTLGFSNNDLYRLPLPSLGILSS